VGGKKNVKLIGKASEPTGGFLEVGHLTYQGTMVLPHCKILETWGRKGGRDCSRR